MALTKVSSGLISADASSVDLNIDAGTLYIDATNNRVGVGTTSPVRDLHIHNTTQPYFHMTSGDTGSTATDGFSIIVEDNTNDVLLNQRENATIRTYVNGSERMRIDSSGNVGIGVTPVSAEGSFLQFGNQYSISQRGFGRNTYYDGSNYRAIATGGATLTVGGDDHIFYTASSVSAGATQAFTERMRIDSSGNLMVGITSVISSATTSIYKSSLDYGLFIRKGDGTTGSTNKYIGFDISGGGTAGGSITNSSAGNAQFTATSDERLKENIQDISGCLDKVMALKPSSYTLKQNQLNVPYGFIAQNVETVLPEFVSENEEGWKQISDGLTSGYIAVLTKAIQEQQVLIEELKTRIETLENS